MSPLLRASKPLINDNNQSTFILLKQLKNNVKEIIQKFNEKTQTSTFRVFARGQKTFKGNQTKLQTAKK